MGQSVTDFYDKLSKEYTQLIAKCVPKYDEMLISLFCYLPKDFKPKKILDLGCGTGNLTALILSKFPNAEVYALDISPEILNQCKVRFKEHSNVFYIEQGFKDLTFEDNYFDLIVSSIAIHHVNDVTKVNLYQKIKEILKPRGIFEFADQTYGSTEEIYQTHLQRWKAAAFELGSTQENWDMWMKHQTEHDYHSPVLWHIKELEKTGFKNVDVLWKNIMWLVLYGEKD
jgi:tRNA (cmo5U34)-methyltransferase